MVDSMTQGFVLASKVLNSRIKQSSGPVEVHKIHHIYSFSYNIRCKILVKEQLQLLIMGSYSGAQYPSFQQFNALKS